MKRIMILVLMLALAFSVSALEINSPEDKTYNTTAIALNITHSEELDIITYKIDGSAETLACDNCSAYDEELNLSEGNHTISVIGVKGNETYNDSVSFTIELPVIAPKISLEILAPENKTYNATDISLDILASEMLDNISYAIDNSTEIPACEDCSHFIADLNLSEGDHTLFVKGIKGSEVYNETVSFNIELPEEVVETPRFSLDIESPVNKDYNYSEISISVNANETLDRITLIIDDEYNESCENCSSFNDTINLSEGNYVLVAKGFLGETVKQKSVHFSVNFDEQEEEEDDNDGYQNRNETSPRFSLGFEKLPQAVERGEISDSELAEIIRENKINPGILNRLIKTGMLGNESIEAILDTQFKPQGLFSKLLSYLGIQQDTYSSLIYENYNLSEKLEQKLVTREDLPKGLSNKIQSNMQKRMGQIETTGNNNNGNNNEKTIQVGKQDKIPPGQEKKMDSETVNGNGNGNKGSRGQGQGNGKGGN